MSAIDYYPSIEAVDAMVEIWHTTETELELIDFLGLTRSEYELYVTNPNEFKKLLKGE